jgi:hypothetical protein
VEDFTTTITVLQKTIANVGRDAVGTPTGWSSGATSSSTTTSRSSEAP